MRSVGMGAMPDSEEDKRLLAEITELKAENTALKQEIAELKAKKSTRKGKTDSAAEDHAAE
mgnify:CR=1 FL=1